MFWKLPYLQQRLLHAAFCSVFNQTADGEHKLPSIGTFGDMDLLSPASCLKSRSWPARITRIQKQVNVGRSRRITSCLNCHIHSQSVKCDSFLSNSFWLGVVSIFIHYFLVENECSTVLWIRRNAHNIRWPFCWLPHEPSFICQLYSLDLKKNTSSQHRYHHLVTDNISPHARFHFNRATQPP